jgi:hypothetical protein
LDIERCVADEITILRCTPGKIKGSCVADQTKFFQRPTDSVYNIFTQNN